MSRFVRLTGYHCYEFALVAKLRLLFGYAWVVVYLLLPFGLLVSRQGIGKRRVQYRDKREKVSCSPL